MTEGSLNKWGKFGLGGQLASLMPQETEKCRGREDRGGEHYRKRRHRVKGGECPPMGARGGEKRFRRAGNCCVGRQGVVKGI